RSRLGCSRPGTLSNMRCFGEYLVREGMWSANPLRWVKRPKITPPHDPSAQRGVHDLRGYSLSPQGAEIIQMPRPWVAAISFPFGSSVSWLTTTFGTTLPYRSDVVPLSDEVKTPKSVATASLPPSYTRSSMGASGSEPERPAQLAPPVFVSKT